MLPFELIHLDLLGPLTMSKGNTHGLVVVDAATRYTWLRPLKMTTAEMVARKVYKIFSDFGWPSDYTQTAQSH